MISQFFCLFHLVIRHKPRKKYIIPATLNELINVNNLGLIFFYLKLDTLFVYHTILIKIHLDLVSYILEGYIADN